MTTDSGGPGPFTQLLLDWRNGDVTALARLTPLVQDELHRLARHYMSQERPGHTLQATARVVELRFFGGLSLEETAEVLNVSVDTIGRDWNAAKAWLLRELTRRPEPSA